MSDLAQRAQLRRDIRGSSASPFVRVSYHRIGLYVALADAALIFCASVLSDLSYSYFGHVRVPDMETSSGIGIVACAVYWLVAHSSGLYSLPSLLAPRPRLSPILIGWVAVFLWSRWFFFFSRPGLVSRAGR